MQHVLLYTLPIHELLRWSCVYKSCLRYLRYKSRYIYNIFAFGFKEFPFSRELK